MQYCKRITGLLRGSYSLTLTNLLVACSMLVCSSCSKDESDLQQLEVSLAWTGNIAADGCGYILTAAGGQKVYKPTNESDIPEAYKTGKPIEIVVKVINYSKLRVTYPYPSREGNFAKETVIPSLEGLGVGLQRQSI